MALQIGDKIPHFSAQDNNGDRFDSEAIIGKKAVVIYFYPKDDTPGCTTQACSFRDQYEDFKDLGVEVIGISSDSVASHNKFVAKYKLPFIVLSDSDNKIRNLFGVKPDFFGLVPGRVTYVVDQYGIIQSVFDGFSAKKHIKATLAMVKKN